MKLKLRRVYDFGADAATVGRDLLSPEGWDAARDLEGPFGLPSTRAEWLAAAATPENAARAAELVALARSLGARRVCSHGVGTALLEQQAQRQAPELEWICTDFAPRTVERLRELFPEAEVVRHDLARDPLPQADLHLLHRLDQELADAQWRSVFARLDAPAAFVPSELLTLPQLGKELLRRVRHPRATSAGWFRSEDALRALWRDRFDDERIELGGLPGFLLRPRS